MRCFLFLFSRFRLPKKLLKVNLVEVFPLSFVLAGAYESFSVEGTPYFVVCTPLDDFVPGPPKNPYFYKITDKFFIYIKEPYIFHSLALLGLEQNICLLNIYQKSKGNVILSKTQKLKSLYRRSLIFLNYEFYEL